MMILRLPRRYCCMVVSGLVETLFSSQCQNQGRRILYKKIKFIYSQKAIILL